MKHLTNWVIMSCHGQAMPGMAVLGNAGHGKASHGKYQQFRTGRSGPSFIIQ